MAAPVSVAKPKEGQEAQLNAAFPAIEKPWLSSMYRVLTALSAWLVIGMLLFKPNMKIFGYPVLMFVALGIICFCAKVRGAKVFGKTPVDLAFVLWLGLAVISQMWGMMVLNRVLQADDITQYLIIILTTWLAFRVAFALSCVDPRTATGAFLKAILFCLGLACVVGILQGYGPGPLKQWAVDFGVNFGTKGDITALQVEYSQSPRPVAVYSGPNYYGFMNLIGMCILIGMTLAQGRSMSTRSVWSAAAGLTIFLVGTVVAQSRFAILTAVLLLLVFMYLMFRMGQTKLVLTGGIALGAVFLAGVMFLNQMDLTYLEGTFQRKVTDDGSYQQRAIGFDALRDQAVDLAAFGGGFDAHGFILDRSGDVWSRTNSIDNGYLQAYINHGIPGVIHILFFLWSLWWAIGLAKRHNLMHIRTLRIIASLLLITYMVYSLSGVRHAKLETGLYWMIVFGLLYGSLYADKYFGQNVLARKQELPQEAA
jgi:hypothetical protein